MRVIVAEGKGRWAIVQAKDGAWSERRQVAPNSTKTCHVRVTWQVFVLRKNPRYFIDQMGRKRMWAMPMSATDTV